MIYTIFDVDGTICPVRQPMEESFLPTFENYCKTFPVIIVSGSTKTMIQEQIPEYILDLVELYTCSGIEGCSIDVDIKFKRQAQLIEVLEFYLHETNCPNKTGNHIDIRKGMINFSFPGRNANYQERQKFVEWNKIYNRAETIKYALDIEFPELEFRLGGETSIDITNKGINKSLVAKDILAKDSTANFVFYGDQILDGNDYPLAKFIHDNDLGYSVQISYNQLKKIL